MDILQSQSGPRVTAEARISVDPPSLLTLTGAYLDVNWPATAPNIADIVPGKRLVVNPTADLNAGYSIGDCRVKSAGVVTIQFFNCTAGTLNPGAQNMDFTCIG